VGAGKEAAEVSGAKVVALARELVAAQVGRD